MSGRDEPLDDFNRCVGWGGTPSATCVCGRLHFDSSGQYMEEGELEELQERARLEPENVRGEDGSVRVSVLGWVDGCDCGHHAHIASWLLNNRAAVLDFYKRRLAQWEIDRDELEKLG